MPQYTVQHQCDRTCANCEYYDYEIVWDSFGPVREEYCSKSHYGHVGWYSEPCEEFKPE